MPQLLNEYTLVVCEKPEAAKRIADALAEDGVDQVKVEGIPVFRIRRRGAYYVVCSALGHLYTVADPSRKRQVFPIFDIEWFPIDTVEKEKGYVGDRIKSIQKLSQGVYRFIHACDYDIEGETLGYNILKHACGGKEGVALRAKFSTLTRDEIRAAFDNAQVGLSAGLAQAGRTRHEVDFIWGINLSRALSESFYSANKGYRNVTVGRVQGPTLSYVVDREIELRIFVPTPYWVVVAEMEKDGEKIVAEYEEEKVLTRDEAFRVKKACMGRLATVGSVKSTVFRQSPPTPFNLGDLQKEAYRAFGFSPSLTLGVAERLYLDALISYPRTSSQKLPPSIDCRKILEGLAVMNSYRLDANELLQTKLVPRQGDKDDSAHPAIYPTGETPRRNLESREFRLYDLIVRRFFSVFGEDALRERVISVLTVESYNFKVSGRRTLKDGWLKYYRNYTGVEDVPIPRLVEGDVLRVLKVKVDEKYEQPPPRYNQSSLLDKMEKERIGTKATRSEIIKTLYDRDYVIGEAMSATDLGFAVVEVMRRYCPSIVSTEMTKHVEAQLELVEEGEAEGGDVLEESAKQLLSSLRMIRQVEQEIGKKLKQASISTVIARNTLGSCPICKTGKLIIIRSKITEKRFVGCTNYRNGCRASAPLPQKGALRTTSKVCGVCSWPIVYVRLSRIPWRLCINLSCPTKEARRKNAVWTVQKSYRS